MIKFLFRFLSLWPFIVLQAMGCLLGWGVYGLSANYRRKMQAHIAVAFEQPLKRLNVEYASVAHAGMGLFELPFLWGRSTERGAASCTTIRNWNVVEAAQQAGKGVIFLTPHLGGFEATAQMFATFSPITVLYRPNRNPKLQELIEASRRRPNMTLAPTNLSGVRALIRALRRGEAVGMLPDQVPNQGEGVWAPMFGQPAYTMTLPASLFHATGARIVLAVGIRRGLGRGLEVLFEPGPEQLSKDPVEAATQINQCMEALILRYPAQYYWGYERYREPRASSSL